MRVRNALSLLMFVVIVIGGLVPEVAADRKRLLKPSEKEGDNPSEVYNESRDLLSVTFALGKLMGDVTDYIDESKDEIVYGFGFGYEHYFRPAIGLGGELRFMYLSKLDVLPEAIKSTEYRLYGIYRFKPAARHSMYFKFGYGGADGSMGNYSANGTQMRFGIGVLNLGSGKANNRFELCYNIINPEDDADLPWGYTFPNTVDYLALEISFGLSL